MASCSLLLLIPRAQGDDDAQQSSQESRRRVVNSKLVDLAIKQCSTSRLDVLLPRDEARQVLSQLYNDIWDGQLVHGRAKTLDVRVVFDEAATNTRYHTVFTAAHTTANSDSSVVRLDCTLEAESDYVLYDNEHDVARFSQPHVALGGTFDQLHAGHKKLLCVAVESALESITVGVTSDAMLQKKKNADKIERLDVRMARVASFIDSIKRPGQRVEVVKIDDAFGPTVTMRELDALVCSSETLLGAKMVNEERAKVGFPPLLPIVTIRSNAYVLSSTFLREKL